MFIDPRGEVGRDGRLDGRQCYGFRRAAAPDPIKRQCQTEGRRKSSSFDRLGNGQQRRADAAADAAARRPNRHHNGSNQSMPSPKLRRPFSWRQGAVRRNERPLLHRGNMQ